MVGTLQQYVLTDVDKQALKRVRELSDPMLVSVVREVESRCGFNLMAYPHMEPRYANSEAYVHELLDPLTDSLNRAIFTKDGEVALRTFSSLQQSLADKKSYFVEQSRESGLHVPPGFAEAIYDEVCQRLMAVVENSRAEQVGPSGWVR